jgi:hypothetical protein
MMFALIGYLSCRNLKRALSVARLPREAPVVVNGGTTPRETRAVLAAGVAGLMFKTGRCPGRVKSAALTVRRSFPVYLEKQTFK